MSTQPTAREALHAALADVGGPRLARDVRAEVAAALSISENAVSSAAAKLRRYGRLENGKTADGKTTWTLLDQPSGKACCDCSRPITTNDGREPEPWMVRCYACWSKHRRAQDVSDAAKNGRDAGQRAGYRDGYANGHRDGMDAGLRARLVTLTDHADAHQDVPAALGAAYLAACAADPITQLQQLRPLLTVELAELDREDALLRALELGVRLGRYVLESEEATA